MYAKRGDETNMTILKFNGQAMPTPKPDGFTISKNKIWSRNTGRNSLGNMVGTIIAVKTSIDITWPPLSFSQIEMIDNIVSDVNNPFVNIEYLNERGNMTQITAYFSDVSYPIKSIINGREIIDGIQLSGIQQ